jgi:hypothetical protein
VAGFEYTFFGVRGSDNDLGLLMEYLYDDRGPSEPVTTLDDDVFIGTRFTFNDIHDTNFLAGVVVDTNEKEWFLNLEAERRLGDNYFLEGRLRVFNGERQLNQLYSFDRDDYLQLSLVRYF